MAFSNTALNEMDKPGSGIEQGNANIIFSSATFEEGLIPGRFAKLDTGSIDNLDGSANPVIPGVVLYNPSSTIEDNGTFYRKYHPNINYIVRGIVTVDVKAGETPAAFGDVYASNAADVSAGKATANDTDIATGWKFHREIKSGVWEIFK